MNGVFKPITENFIFPVVIIVAAWYILVHGLIKQTWVKVAGNIIISVIIVGIIFAPDTLKTIGAVVLKFLSSLFQFVLGG